MIERKTRMDAFGTSIMLGFSALLGVNQALVKIVNGGLAKRPSVTDPQQQGATT